MAVRKESVVVTADVNNFVTRFAAAGKAARTFASDLDAADTRMSNLVQTAMAVGPALVPLSAAVVPAVAGLATQLGFAAAGAGTMVLAFQGLGDTLGALNDYHLNPTADNLEKVHQELDRLSPAAQEFAFYIDAIRPRLDDLQDASQEGFFPGAQDGMEALLRRLPEVESIISTSAETIGNLLRQGGENLAGDGWDDFFSYVDDTARPIMQEMGRTLGNFVQGTAELWMAVDPMSRDFSEAFLRMSRDYNEWADGLEDSEGLEHFLDYISGVGPQAWDTLGSVAEALLELAEAGAPVGAVVLPVIEVLAETLSVVAESDAGPVLVATAAGVAAVSRAVAVYNAANGSAFGTLFDRLAARPRNLAGGLKADAAAMLDFGSGLDTWGKKAETVTTTNERLRRSFGRLAAAGAGVGLFAAAMTDLDDKMGLSNTTMLAMLGLMGGPWGAAAGAFVGATMDASAANNDFYSSLERANDAMRRAPGELRAQADAVAATRAEYEAFYGTVTADPDKLFNGNAFSALGELFGTALNPAGLKNAWEDVLGTSDLDEMRSALADQEEQLDKNVFTWNRLNDVLNEGQFSSAITDLDELSRIATYAQPAMDALGITFEDLQNMTFEEFQAAARAIDDYADSADSTAGRTRAVADAVAGLDDELETTTDSANALANALEALINPTLNAEQATDEYITGLREMRAILEGNTKTFEGNTTAAMENREATRSQAAAIVEMLTARAEAGASSEQIARGLARSREAFIREGVAAGFSREEMEKRAKAVGLTPSLVRTIFKSEGLDSLSDKVEELKRKYDLTPRQVRTVIEQINMGKSQDDIERLLTKYGLTPKQINTAVRLFGAAAAEAELNRVAKERQAVIYVRTVNQGYGAGSRGGQSVVGGTSADGNLFDYYAGGGIRRRLPRIGDQYPQIRPFSGPRGLVWSEEGSGPWEAFISGQPSKRPRSRSIAEEVVARLGGHVAWFASGGLLEQAYRAAPAAHRPTAPTVNVTTSTGPVSAVARLSDGDVRAIARAVRDGLAGGMAALSSSAMIEDYT